MKSIAVLLVLCTAHLVVASAHPARLTDGMQASWLAFKAKHGRNYTSELVDAMRMRMFAEDKQRVELFNEHLSQSTGFSLGLNHLSDYTEAERAKLKGFELKEVSANSLKADKFLQDILNDPSPLPKEVDWRKIANRVSRVKDQGLCRSCWAFSTTGALEGQQVVRRSNGSANSGKLVELSEQNLVDCVLAAKGCDGGWMDDALTFVHQQGGLDSEQSYPYEAADDDCRFKKSSVVMSDDGAARLPVGDEEALKKVVAKFGPVSAAIATNPLFDQYESGIFNYPSCKNGPNQLDHAILVVGYGTDPKRGDFWIVKNSWAEQWGDKGYVLMSRNRENQCGIATHAVIPTF